MRPRPQIEYVASQAFLMTPHSCIHKIIQINKVYLGPKQWKATKWWFFTQFLYLFFYIFCKDNPRQAESNGQIGPSRSHTQPVYMFIVNIKSLDEILGFDFRWLFFPFSEIVAMPSQKRVCTYFCTSSYNCHKPSNLLLQLFAVLRSSLNVECSNTCVSIDACPHDTISLQIK